jgi:hypothetical protein
MEYYFLCSGLEVQSDGSRYYIIYECGIMLAGSLSHLQCVDCMSETWDWCFTKYLTQNVAARAGWFNIYGSVVCRVQKSAHRSVRSRGAISIGGRRCEPPNTSIGPPTVPHVSNMHFHWRINGHPGFTNFKPRSPEFLISKLRVVYSKRKAWLCHVQKSGRKTGLDFLVTFLVNSGISQYPSSFGGKEKQPIEVCS